MSPLTCFQLQHSDSTHCAVMSVLPFRLNFVTDRFNECTTIYSYKKMIKKKKSCRKRKYSCIKHVQEMKCDDLSDE